MTADPLSALSPAALATAHERLHDRVAKGDTLSAADVEVHHLLADELRRRGLDHPPASDGLHDAAITMSKVTVPLRALRKMLNPTEVEVIARMAAANGTSFADVFELLTANGWMLRAEPAQIGPDDAESDDEGEYEAEHGAALNERQNAVYEGIEAVVERYGMFDQSAGAHGAHYMADNPFAADGIKCSNCVAFRGGNGCEWVSGEILPEAVCKLWVISESLVAEKARDLTKEIRQTGDGWCVYSKDGARSFGCYATQAEAQARLAQIESFKAATFTPPAGVREEARRAIAWIEEGHAGSGFTAVGRKRATQLANGDPVSAETLTRMASYFARHEVDATGKGWSPGEDGYPSPGRVAWAAWGGDPGRRWAEAELARLNKAAGEPRSLIVKQVDERRFTLGPWYVPDALDAHGEWTDPDELQAALWDYVRKGNRDIRLQHTPETKAGEWVEAMTWPFPVRVPMLDPTTGAMKQREFPAGTVFLGVQWEQWAWDMVKTGQITGYSIGGSAERVDEDPRIYVGMAAQ